MSFELSSSNAILSSLMREPTPDVQPLVHGVRNLSVTHAQGKRVSAQEAAVEFEAYMLRMILSEMRKTVGEGGLFGSSHTQRYTALLDDALARRAAEAQSFGLARQMLDQWESRS